MPARITDEQPGCEAAQAPLGAPWKAPPTQHESTRPVRWVAELECSTEVTVRIGTGKLPGFTRQRRQDSSAKGNALVTRPAIRFPALKGQNSDGCCPFRAKQCGLAEFPGRWPGLTSGCTFGAKAMVRMKQRSPITYQARGVNRQKSFCRNSSFFRCASSERELLPAPRLQLLCVLQISALKMPGRN